MKRSQTGGNFREMNDHSSSMCFLFASLEKHACYLHRSECQLCQRDRSALVPIELWLQYNNIKRWLTASYSGLCVGVRVQNWQNKTDTSSFRNVSLFNIIPPAIMISLRYEHLSRCPMLICIIRFTSCQWYNGTTWAIQLALFSRCLWFPDVTSYLIYVSLLNLSHKSWSHGLNDKQMLTIVQ